MHPVNSVPGTINVPPQQHPVFHPAPGQPMPQVVPAAPHGDAAGLALVPMQLEHHPNVPLQPALVGALQLPLGQGAMLAAAAELELRNETMLDRSAAALAQLTAHGWQGQTLDTARQAIFHQYRQVKLEIPADAQGAGYICDPYVLPGLELNYLELSAPLLAGTERGSEAQTFRFDTTSICLAKALAALNAHAAQSIYRPRLGIEVVAASASSYSAMLDLSYTRFCKALAADKLLVYLKIESLSREEGENPVNVQTFFESLQGHPSLQRLVLADTCVDETMAFQMQAAMASIPTLLQVDLSAGRLTEEAADILGAIRRPRMVLPG